MRSTSLLVVLLATTLQAHASEANPSKGESVVVLHGLARNSSSMSRMGRALQKQGYHVCSVSYPSRKYTIEVLAADFVAQSVRTCHSNRPGAVHFVTHSMGGIIVRQLATSASDFRIGRVVMLSPPNHGSEVVDKLGKLGLFRFVNGPAGLQLGTGDESVPLRLGSAPFDVGVITGRRTINPVLSLLIPGPDDGKVSIASARLAGMTDFCVVPSSHPFIMNSDYVIEQTVSFLAKGAFACHAHNSMHRDRREDAARVHGTQDLPGPFAPFAPFAPFCGQSSLCSRRSAQL